MKEHKVKHFESNALGEGITAFDVLPRVWFSHQKMTASIKMSDGQQSPFNIISYIKHSTLVLFSVHFSSRFFCCFFSIDVCAHVRFSTSANNQIRRHSNSVSDHFIFQQKETAFHSRSWHTETDKKSPSARTKHCACQFVIQKFLFS